MVCGDQRTGRTSTEKTGMWKEIPALLQRNYLYEIPRIGVETRRRGKGELVCHMWGFSWGRQKKFLEVRHCGSQL